MLVTLKIEKTGIVEDAKGSFFALESMIPTFRTYLGSNISIESGVCCGHVNPMFGTETFLADTSLENATKISCFRGF